MQAVESISVKLRRLPEEKQLEVEGFIDSLLAELRNESGDPPDELSDLEAEKILDETFGAWNGEVDGVEYVNRIRKQWRNRTDGLPG